MLTTERTSEIVRDRFQPRIDGHEPSWEIADLFPQQGVWTEADYIRLADATNRLTELSNGRIELLPVPTEEHQFILLFLRDVLNAFVQVRRLGATLVAPLRVYLGPGRYREPDVMFLLEQNFHRRHSGYWEGADLVMEVVSESDPDRDLITKRMEYAQAGIPEYWIVDPRDETIAVLTLDGESYREHGSFRRGEVAASVLLSGFEVEVAAAFDAAKQ